MPTLIPLLHLSKNKRRCNTSPWFLFLFVFFISFFSNDLSAKKSCENYEHRLHKIQIAQRSGHSLKRANSLNEQERVLREKWWQCKKSSGKARKSRKKIAKNKSKKSYKDSQKSYRAIPLTTVSPFKTSQAIVIKEKYQGEKKFAWLRFYQQPEKCQRPKNLPTFAFCTEDKQQQRQVFEQTFR